MIFVTIAFPALLLNLGPDWTQIESSHHREADRACFHRSGLCAGISVNYAPHRKHSFVQVIGWVHMQDLLGLIGVCPPNHAPACI